jgi:hypothetical protein
VIRPKETRRRVERLKRKREERRPTLKLGMRGSSSTLLLAFGGLNRRIGMPPFEFLTLTGDLPVKRMFLRDHRGSWYHEGLPRRGDTLTAVADSLRAEISKLGVQRLVVAGNSASEELDELRALAAADALDQRWSDLGEALRHQRDSRTRYRVFFDTTHTKDRLHAEHLIGIEGLRLYRFGEGGHELVRRLRDVGALERIVQDAVLPPAG